MNNTLNPIQNEILKAIEQMSDKSSFTEFVLAKKIRQNAKIDGKKKAGIGLSDILAVLDILAEKNIFYSIHVNSVNDILLKKETEKTEISLDAKHRRNASEKSMSIFTSRDLESSGKKKMSNIKRSERKSLNVNRNWEDE